MQAESSSEHKDTTTGVATEPMDDIALRVSPSSSTTINTTNPTIHDQASETPNDKRNDTLDTISSSGTSVMSVLSDITDFADPYPYRTMSRAINGNIPPLYPSPGSKVNSTVIADAEDVKAQYQEAEGRMKPVPEVAAEMEKWYWNVDRYGFMFDEQTSLNAPNRAHTEREISRAEKWQRMAKRVRRQNMEVFDFAWTAKLVARVYKGVPDSWRREVWYYFVTGGLRDFDEDVELLAKYKELLDQSSEHDRQIDLDIPRTMHGHVLFRTRYGYGQRALFNVLRAFAILDPKVGYCQGMTNVAAMLLLYFEEERCFTGLMHMFERYRLRNLFVPGFPALMEAFFVQERLMEMLIPKVAKHLDNLMISSSSYATRWYITLYTGAVIPYHLLLRIWDLMFLCGFDILIYTAIALLKWHQEFIISAEFETIMERLNGLLTVHDDDKFVHLIRKLYEKGQSRCLTDRLRGDYTKSTS
ncbi:hypothetical protein BZG36_00836 [Bifiguratus adelaidae]|uniref:Rab-GAP TBC domain-containing protein n=1 Tax=Bifiguratus adelaidae TaxID=1938954 RepID=A0A261Y6K8_9FUNG|nr:hypothetical protein BZG36_00836 [Bifiguratus adelaidae]